MMARRMANEASAIKMIDTLAAAEITYRATTGEGKCGEINDLVSSQLVPAEFAKLEKNGYKFKIVKSDVINCEVHAAPISTSSGTRSFMFSTYDGTLHAGDKKGGFATYNDPKLDSLQPIVTEEPMPTRY
jgi:hypothetical protein